MPCKNCVKRLRGEECRLSKACEIFPRNYIGVEVVNGKGPRCQINPIGLIHHFKTYNTHCHCDHLLFLCELLILDKNSLRV